MSRITCTAILMIALCSEAFSGWAGDPAGDSGAAFPQGLTTTAGKSVYLSSLSQFASLDNRFCIGMGYNLSSSDLLGIIISTGSENVGAATSEPITGSLALGSGAVQMLHRFCEHSAWRPVAGASYELATILAPGNVRGANSSGSGYNGHGFGLTTGVEYFVSRSFSISLCTSFTYRSYSDLIIAGDVKGKSPVGVDRLVGLTLSANIHYNFLP